MRRDINWSTKRDDGSKYDVRVTWFSGHYKLQFKESKEELWDYTRQPTKADLTELLDHIRRRYQRRTATLKELEEAERLYRATPDDPAQPD